ncbi:MAG: hypothetical protein EAZ97_06450 [Bacteroidetes bacterium]|nr:MAG: hypothetical protein EAZ97_06450 [Bacteroidota bacterium]
MNFTEKRTYLETSKAIAVLVSLFAHPIFMPTWVFVTLCFGTDLVSWTFGTKSIWLILVFMFTTVLPLGTIRIFYESNHIQRVDMQLLSDRNFGYLIVLAYYMAATIIFYGKLNHLYELAFVMQSITFSVFLATFISFYYKISIHAVGIGGLIGILLGYQYHFGEQILLYPILFAILLAGVVISARFYLQAHSISELIYGLFLGLGVCFCSLYFWGFN